MNIHVSFCPLSLLWANVDIKLREKKLKRNVHDCINTASLLLFFVPNLFSSMQRIITTIRVYLIREVMYRHALSRAEFSIILKERSALVFFYSGL